MLEAQLVETAILTFINHQTLIASKAAKICAAAGGGVMESRPCAAHRGRMRACTAPVPP